MLEVTLKITVKAPFDGDSVHDKAIIITDLIAAELENLQRTPLGKINIELCGERSVNDIVWVKNESSDIGDSPLLIDEAYMRLSALFDAIKVPASILRVVIKKRVPRKMTESAPIVFREQMAIEVGELTLYRSEFNGINVWAISKDEVPLLHDSELVTMFPLLVHGAASEDINKKLREVLRIGKTWASLVDKGSVS